MNKRIAILGSGRMGEGIALSFILSGQDVVMFDFKSRGEEERDTYYLEIKNRLLAELRYLESRSNIREGMSNEIVSRLQIVDANIVNGRYNDIKLAFEAVPEVKEIKRKCLAWASEHFYSDVVIASTTSTFLVTELSEMVSYPERFMNAHWLNPAYLMPLVEVSKGENTQQHFIDFLFKFLQEIGKVPVLCNASPGYIVPRLQVLIMNEAARMVEEGVASAEDIDTATRIGFGLRYSVLGVLEFIDWGGGDTLYYASDYLSEMLGERFKAPDVVQENMRLQKRGFRDGRGFFEYKGIDLEEHRKRRSDAFIERLRISRLMPATL
ncbi:3-hydroxybutyryl-CoA dehydrogenase [Halomonas sp. McH1-25]|uniref:3-hydroxybutyryl-CoA dehydrogenase n=1 Tax=unclassified Halomonas TaxID=2609666 RepID=UPI001EF5CC07|nr:MULTISPECIES: 3-hydroxybutyryl-CoA dehydrogenase [unclassified Halomonas]MCG7602190.1 3-hydroxybutyryl-CoA dehydrogenase [Halomonas sp. McH1-25]MCP1344667.1 3-hydroxybutyryl-CoA dehydrogenase [Halomonas sp. FL8]MCP1362475.1 3-hydroxybutyryl-CoA dehydrogenase [Halomonas sp. BBD45]MCP1364575.1 3-hydroxybutyryl-CoA dehydrogenase [Halomonas sp. BBD48]